jgi:hypothetical protein
MKSVERRGAGNRCWEPLTAPVFPLLYEIAAMNKNGKQVLHVAGGTVSHG